MGDDNSRSTTVINWPTGLRAYHQPSHWRDIADANGIDDPLRVRAGRTLVVPDKATLPRRGESGRPVSTSGISSSPNKADR